MDGTRFLVARLDVVWHKIWGRVVRDSYNDRMP
jgi:hypothetical protein